MAVTAFDGQFSFRQDSVARLGVRERKGMSEEQWSNFQNSPFMQGVRKTEDLCLRLTGSRDELRAKSDPSFNPCDDDFTAPKSHSYDKCVDYYKVLGIDEYSPLDEVKKAYKKLSLVYHPDKTSGLSEEVKEEYAGIFIELKNAYLTLSDQPTRRQYDRDRDRDKAAFEVNGFKPKKRAHFDATEVLKKLQGMQKAPGKVVEVPIKAKLEKFFYGGHKRIMRQRRIKERDVWTTETRAYRVDIPRGASSPHECAFKRQGDHNEDAQPDTVKFIITDKPHDIVERQGIDLSTKGSIYLGEEALRKPYVSAETPSVRGRHLLLWGRNPFFSCAGVTAASLLVRVRGEGISQAGVLRFCCRLGKRPLGGITAPARATNGVAKATSPSAPGASVVVIVRHMQTDARLWLRFPSTAVMADVRNKITSVCNLRRGATVRLLQQASGQTFSPFSDRRPITGLQNLNCAGQPWYGPELTAETSKQLVQKVINVLEPKDLRSIRLSGKAVHDTMTELAELMADFGFQPTLQVFNSRLTQAKQALQRAGDPSNLVQKLAKLEQTMTETNGHAAPTPSSPSAAPPRDEQAVRKFLQRFNLGPPGGFSPSASDAEDKDEQPQHQQQQQDGGSCSSTARACPIHGSGGLCDVPAMRRRIDRRRTAELSCEVELSQIGEPITLYTRPTCTITFYSNARQSAVAPGPGAVVPRPVFAISISATACIKKQGAREWELLKSWLAPLLASSAFYLLHAARAVLPRSIPNAPCAPQQDEEDHPEPEAELEGAFDYRSLLDANSSLDPEQQRCVCENAKRDRREFLVRQRIVKKAASSELPTPWKKFGDDAFRRGDYFSAIRIYTSHCLSCEADAAGKDAWSPQESGAILSNLAGCYARVGHFEASLQSARDALEIRPGWGKALSRIGHAALSLGLLSEAVDAYVQAVTSEPNAANVTALADAVSKLKSDPDAAHGQKEVGNGAMRTAEYGLAVAQYTRAMALLPASPVLPSETAQDEFAFLRSVLYSNRSAAFSHVKNWSAALADARKAVALKEDFGKAHRRLGTALLGSGLTEEAYSAFARALVLEADEPRTLKGRQECLKMLPAWASQSALRRFRLRYSRDLIRPKGSSKVYAISDMHYDHKCNEDWAHRIDDFKFQEDVLICAGNLADSKTAIVRALTTLKSKFRRVFWVPGNHEMWLHPSEGNKYADTFVKFTSILDACDELGVDVFPAVVAQDLFIVPMFSWYNAEFDEADPFPDPNSQADKNCRWPIPETQIWRYMLRLNAANLVRPYHGTVISFSHFLPHRRLPFHRNRGVSKTIGCSELEEQVLAVKGEDRMHVYGHSTERSTTRDKGIWYINHYHGEDAGREDKAPLLLIHDGKSTTSRAVRHLVPIY